MPTDIIITMDTMMMTSASSTTDAYAALLDAAERRWMIGRLAELDPQSEDDRAWSIR